MSLGVLVPFRLVAKMIVHWVIAVCMVQIWRLDCAGGTAHHVAGTGEQGPAGDGGPAKDAKLTGPKGIALGKGHERPNEKNKTRYVPQCTRAHDKSALSSCRKKRGVHRRHGVTFDPVDRHKDRLDPLGCRSTDVGTDTAGEGPSQPDSIRAWRDGATARRVGGQARVRRVH